jgi:hypothetical protein
MRVPVYWLKPSPLRGPITAAGVDADLFAPQILEHATDDFMDVFLAAAATGGSALTRLVPPAATDGRPLKLFQPAHGRFYLVCASLACRLPDFPDHSPKPEEDERLFFVLRKSIQGAEYGWVPAGKTSGSWKAVAGQALLSDEERLPLIRANAAGGRSLWFGYLPLSGRETYSVAPAALSPPLPAAQDPRLQELQARFIRPMSQVPSLFAEAAATPPGASSEAVALAARRALSLSVYLLLDLYDYLALYLPAVATALLTPAAFTGDKATHQSALLQFLQGQTIGTGLTLGSAVAGIVPRQQDLDGLGDGDITTLGFGAEYSLAAFPPAALTILAQRVRDALPASSQQSLDIPKFVADSQSDTERAGTSFLVRCVYQRPKCDIEMRVSQPSRAFRVAAFFDNEAPARPVRIALPTDVSIGGLRKLKKGVTFLLSESMQRKVERIVGKEAALLNDEGINDEQGGDFAFVCSFSIQIIFIVAFFLLLLFVIILNLVFWWLPFFRICLPIPKKLFSS